MSRSSPAKVAAAFVVATIAVIALWLFIDPLAYSRLYVIFMNLWVPVAIIAVGTGLTVVIAHNFNDGYGVTRVAGGAVTAVVVVAIAALIGFFGVRSWNVSNHYANIPVENEDQPDFAERVPWSVADASANSAMSGINANREHTKYLTGSDTYTTLASERGFWEFRGYDAVIEQGFRLDGGVSENVQCYFSDEADRKLGGFLWRSLERLVASADRHALFDRDDAWSYCDEETAYIVIPLTHYNTNPFNLHHIPAGVAIYNGDTGDVEIRREVEAGELPGPAIAQSYAERIEQKMHFRGNSGGMSGWWQVHVISNVGFETSRDETEYDEDGEVVRESNDPNADNPGNHQLAYGDSGSAHVTPLTRVSTSTAIEYVLTVDSDAVSAGSSPTVEMWQIEPTRESNSVVHDAIRSTYDHINWASGLRVQEITPGPDGSWVASIGQRTSVVYRVTMDVDGNWTIRDLRTGQEEEFTEDEITDDSPPADDSTPTVPAPGSDDLSELTEQELAELGEAILRELAERAETFSESTEATEADEGTE